MKKLENQASAELICTAGSYLSKQLCLGNLLVDLLGKVLVGLECGVRHVGRLVEGKITKWMDVYAAGDMDGT